MLEVYSNDQNSEEHVSAQRYSCKGLVCIVILLATILTGAYSFEQVKISVDGVKRDFQLYIPTTSTEDKIPVVIVFHGHGEYTDDAISRFKLEKIWPEALIVYPQGKKTAIQQMDPQGKFTGWQTFVGHKKDEDIRFFDEIVAYLSNKYTIDHKRIYVTGFSNGAAFTYVLAAVRGTKIAAIAPIAGTLGMSDDRKVFEAIPVFHVAGKQDEHVKFGSQKEMIEFIKIVNRCDGEGKTVNKNVTEYESRIAKPLVTFIYNGEHKVPGDAIPFIVEFFKNNWLQ